jgi:hypothetical protein
MKCDHCDHEFDTVALKAKQGTQITCPSCGATTTVRYSFRDTLRDIPGVIRRDPKYVSQRLTVTFWVLVLVVVLLVIRSFIGNQ